MANLTPRVYVRAMLSAAEHNPDDLLTLTAPTAHLFNLPDPDHTTYQITVAEMIGNLAVLLHNTGEVPTNFTLAAD